MFGQSSFGHNLVSCSGFVLFWLRGSGDWRSSSSSSSSSSSTTTTTIVATTTTTTTHATTSASCSQFAHVIQVLADKTDGVGDKE